MPSRNVKARPVSWRISQDRRVNDLGDPWAMLAYTWMIPSADNLGRMEGDPQLLASMIFPWQRNTISPNRMAKIVNQLHETGLVFSYDVAGEKFLQFPAESWRKHQRLVGNMSAESDFPAPPERIYTEWHAEKRVHTSINEDELVINEGKGREGKGREEETNGAGVLTAEEVVDVWNEICGDGLPRVIKSTPSRQKHILARLKAEMGRDASWWRAYFQRIVASSFCRGSNERRWTADIDWAIRSEDVVTKVLEGRYDDRVAKNIRQPKHVEIPDNWGGGDAA